MMISLTAVMAILAQTPPPPEPFALTGMTVVERGSFSSLSDHHRVGYRRIRAAGADGRTTDIYISAFIENAQELYGPREGDICDVSGVIRSWDAREDERRPVGSGREAAPANGQRVWMAEHYACRPGPESEPVSDPFADILADRMPELPTHQISTITIVGVGPKPHFSSGIIMTSILILGQAADGDIDPYYLTYFGPDQPVPPLGGRCTLRHARYRLEFVGGLEVRPGLKGESFEDFECTPPPDPDHELLREDVSDD